MRLAGQESLHKERKEGKTKFGSLLPTVFLFLEVRLLIVLVETVEVDLDGSRGVVGRIVTAAPAAVGRGSRGG